MFCGVGVLCIVGCPLYCGVFSSIPGFFQVGDNQKHL